MKNWVGTRRKQKKDSTPISKFKIDFSFRREVFFIVAGALVGALTYIIPITVFAVEEGSSYYLIWIVFGHIAGVYSPINSVITAGFMLDVLTATSIGIIAGIFLYKTNILNISKPSNGLKYGLLVGTLVFLIFAIPVQEFVLGPEFARTIAENSDMEATPPSNAASTPSSTATENSQPIISKSSLSSTNEVSFVNQLRVFSNSLIINLVFGITLGLFSSLLSIKFGARYRCPKCDISFSRVDSLQRHLELLHGAGPILSKKVLILGGGFAGVEVLRRQHKYQNDVSVDITMVSKDNFFLFTPMLHEVASGMIETRHIVTPIRAFCNRAKFYAARVEQIDLSNKTIVIETPIFSSLSKKNKSQGDSTPEEESNAMMLSKSQIDRLSYDYLVIAIGSETKFFGMVDVEKYAFTIKSWNDAIVIRNHVIHQLEQAEVLLRQQQSQPRTGDDTIINNSNNNNILGSYQEIEKERLLTFVIVGGGFAGVETAGELNDFLRDSVEDYYHNIEAKEIRIIIIQSGKRLLPEMSEELAKFAMQKHVQNGVEIILNTRVTGVTKNSVKTKDGMTISTNTVIWSAGVGPNPIVEQISCKHDEKSGRLVVNKFLEVEGYPGVFAIGDCASIIDPNMGNPYPPTAQHAIREGTVASSNIISLIEGKGEKNRKEFDYKTKGMMASIGKRNGVGQILGFEVQGIVAWWIWRSYYLTNLPTLQKKLRVLADWTIDFFFKRDVTMLETILEDEGGVYERNSRERKE
ncbi:MAG: FAD-dependent oxidoreductase [Nitrososphaeraceae archaeon]